MVVLCWWWGRSPHRHHCPFSTKGLCRRAVFIAATPCPAVATPLPSFSPHLFAAVGLPPASAPSVKEGSAGFPADHTLVGGGMGGSIDGGGAATTQIRSSRVSIKAFPLIIYLQNYPTMDYLLFNSDLFDIYDFM